MERLFFEKTLEERVMLLLEKHNTYYSTPSDGSGCLNEAPKDLLRSLALRARREKEVSENEILEILKSNDIYVTFYHRGGFNPHLGYSRTARVSKKGSKSAASIEIYCSHNTPAWANHVMLSQIRGNIMTITFHKGEKSAKAEINAIIQARK